MSHTPQPAEPLYVVVEVRLLPANGLQKSKGEVRKRKVADVLVRDGGILLRLGRSISLMSRSRSLATEAVSSIRRPGRAAPWQTHAKFMRSPPRPHEFSAPGRGSPPPGARPMLLPPQAPAAHSAHP